VKRLRHRSLIALCALLTLGTIQSEASSLIVSQDAGPIQTIQAAINAAADHDSVFIQAGHYFENLIITKPLSLIGIGEVILETGDSASPAIMVTDVDGIVIRNISIIGAEDGILVTNSSGIVSGCTILDCDTGIRISSDENHTVTVSDVIVEAAGSGIGLSIGGAGETIVLSCALSGLGTGITIGGTARVLVVDSVVEKCFYGFSILSIADIRLVNNDIRHNSTGILVTEPPFEWTQGSLTLLANRINGNSSWGVSLCASDGSEMDVEAFSLLAADNVLMGNVRGATCPEDLVID